MSDVYASLSLILANTYAADKEIRQKAEKDLEGFLKLSNAFNGFLGLCQLPGTDTNIKLAAALTLKNKARDFWQTKDPIYPMTEDEKTYCKDAIITLILNETYNPLRSLLAEVLKGIVEHEYPTNWPQLLPTLVTNLSSPEPIKIYNTLIIIRKLTKFYQFSKLPKRTILYDIIIAVFPTLQGLISSLLNHNTIEVAMVFHITLKIFYSCVMHTLPKLPVESQSACDINFWFQFMSFILEKNLPENDGSGSEPIGQPIHPDERKQWPWWKAKKWSSKTISLILARYGNPNTAAEENEQFAKYFRDVTAPTLLGPIMNSLASVTRGSYITEEVHRHCLSFMSNAIEMAPTYKLIKSHLDFVLFSMIMPTISLTDSDIQLFTDDPQEFVRKINNPMDEWLDPRVSATNLLEALVRLRTKDALPMLMTWITQQLSIYDNEQDINKKNYKLKDSILLAMATISMVSIYMCICMYVHVCIAVFVLVQRVQGLILNIYHVVELELGVVVVEPTDDYTFLPPLLNYFDDWFIACACSMRSTVCNSYFLLSIYNLLLTTYSITFHNIYNF